MSIFGYEEQRSNYNENELQEGELVDCIIIGVDYPATFKNNLDAKELSHKEHGVSVQYAVLTRDRHQGADLATGKLKEKVFLTDEQNYPKAPSFQCYGNFTQWTPPLIFSKFTFPQIGGTAGIVSTKDGLSIPEITQLLPSPYEAKDFKTNTKVSEIEPGAEIHYTALIQAEKERQAKWETILTFWQSLNESEAKEKLLKSLSSRMFLCYNNGNEFVYTPPEVGVLFRARIGKKTGRYFDLEFCKWDKSNKRYEVFSRLNTKKPEEDLVIYAKAIAKVKEDDYKAFLANKDNDASKGYTKPEGDAF